MPTNKNADLKQNYYKLLALKKKNEAAGIQVLGLEDWILENKATMDIEDIEHVEKMISELT